MSPILDAWTQVRHPVIGMLHLLPLPGAPDYAGGLDAVTSRLLGDAEALVSAGVDGLLLENFGDAPFYPRQVPAHTVAQMAALALTVRKRFDRPMGINVLRNDGHSALAIAQAVGADFIRVNVLCSARVTDQGLLEGIAHELLRYRRLIRAEHVKILADVNVKHSAPIGPARPIEDDVADTIQRGKADAVIVSGGGTGKRTDLQELQQVKSAAGDTPVLVGSGVTAETIQDYVPHADGFIIGTAFKCDGRVANAVDLARVRQLMAKLR
jgi:membrane complex biogenesis BtpA family protein